VSNNPRGFPEGQCASTEFEVDDNKAHRACGGVQE